MKAALALTGALFLLAAAVPAESRAAVAVDPPDLVVDPTVETFHNSPTDLCAERVNIDGPVRAFEDQSHVIHLATATPRGRAYQWTGSVAGFTANPRTAALDCDFMMESFSETVPVTDEHIKDFDQKTFLQGFWFDSGSNVVYDYGHEDYYGTRLDPLPPTCDDHTDPSDNGNTCWYSAVAVWTAQVTGPHLEFSRFGNVPNHVAIYPRVVYPGHANTLKAGWIGYGAPSNIVRGRKNGALDTYAYMFVYTSAGDTGQEKGVCLFRNNDPTDVTSWRGWDGDTADPQFTQVMANPYSPGVTNSPCHRVAAPMFQQPVRSVVYHKPSGYYLAFYRAGDGIRYSTSTDLVNWNFSQLLVPGTVDTANYQSVIDFDGGDYGDHNFDRLYDNGKAYLFLRQQLPDGHSRLVRQKLSVPNYPADTPSAG
ncbi:hypothetical protein FB561_0357 [Kribbella amoyensis]|uniref:Glycosyl hydrolase family 32 n=1 Tax=Kribbella amoyensis TaxID=996641 RepID=A0A561BKA8_9ACTN|nr:hypothetical protein [Kribbella amoyensis]TWD79300.1 hypothetical protein FB561_0357 [Kribbella amoyensis]